MLTIIHVIGSARIGGIDKLVLDLMYTQKRNAELTAYLLIAKKDGDFLKRFEGLGVKCHYAYISGGYDLNIKKYYKIFKIFRNYNFLHFHSFNIFMMLAGIFSKKKIVYTKHGNFGFGRKKKKSDFFNTFFTCSQ